jgi:hypothetical protein
VACAGLGPLNWEVSLNDGWQKLPSDITAFWPNSTVTVENICISADVEDKR